MKCFFVRFLCLSSVLLSVCTAADSVDQSFNPSIPVVITVKDAPKFLGKAPREIVGFAWKNEKWVQVPVQVDQKVLAVRGTGKNPNLKIKSRWDFHYVFADPKNANGPASPELKENDEIASLYEDFGSKSEAADPQGVNVKTRVHVSASMYKNLPRSLYLFESAGRLKSDAGREPIAYNFHSLIKPEDLPEWEKITPEISSYRFIPDRNKNAVTYTIPPLPAEDSTVQGEDYLIRFDNRISPAEIKVLASGSSGKNILEFDKFYYGKGMRHHKYLVSLGNRIQCDISGPVRAIRMRQLEWSASQSYDEWIFYPRLIETARNWIIHAGPAVWVSLNFSENALGMTYYDNLNEDGAVIDGQPDKISAGEMNWQFIAGMPGSFLVRHKLDTNIKDIPKKSLYFDLKDPFYFTNDGTFPDTGAFAYGASGPVYGPYPKTVPKGEKGDYMVIRRSFMFGSPGISLKEAKAAAQSQPPIIEVDGRKIEKILY
jgi:hypothetical protein